MRIAPVVACLAACLLTSCGNQQGPPDSLEQLQRVAITNLDSLLLAQAQAHRVLLLGEGRRHDDHAAYGAVLGLLTHWLDEIESGAEVPRRLTLALEYPGVVGEQLRAYFATGDVAHFGLELQGRRVSTLLFFHNLRGVYHRAQALNASHGVDLEILCPEYDYPLFLSPGERRRLADTERDDRTAATVLSYLRENPERMFVAFYGAGHIAERPEPIAETTPWGVQVAEQGIDVGTIVLFGVETPEHDLPLERMETDFALTREALATLLPAYEPRTDAEAYYRQPYIHTVPLKDVPSRLVVSRALDYADEMPQLAPAIAALWQKLSGRFVPPGADVADYVRGHLDELDALAAIDDLALLGRVLEGLAARGRPREEIDRVMFELTGFQNVLDHGRYPIPPGASAAELWAGVMRDYAKPIKAGLYTSVLLYGTPEEKAGAADRLRRLSGQERTDPNDWFRYAWELWAMSSAESGVSTGEPRSQ